MVYERGNVWIAHERLLVTYRGFAQLKQECPLITSCKSVNHQSEKARHIGSINEPSNEKVISQSNIEHISVKQDFCLKSFIKLSLAKH
jgi:hypothetical protein